MTAPDAPIRSVSRGGSCRLGLLCLLCLTGAAGCATVPADFETVPIEADRYAEAFDAALEVAGEFGMPPVLRNRRSGIIETEPLIAPSLAEPPRIDRPGGDRLENTISLRRRRVRFEFSAIEPRTDVEEAETLTGPDLLSAGDAPDLTELGEALELRVRVYLEQAHTPGIRRSTWSRRLTTRPEIIEPDEERRALPRRFWTAVAREEELERRLLAAVRDRLRD